MDKLNNTYKLQTVKDLTMVAIQNGLIVKSADSAKTARNVIEFYQTLYKNIEFDEDDSE